MQFSFASSSTTSSKSLCSSETRSLCLTSTTIVWVWLYGPSLQPCSSCILNLFRRHNHAASESTLQLVCILRQPSTSISSVASIGSLIGASQAKTWSFPAWPYSSKKWLIWLSVWPLSISVRDKRTLQDRPQIDPLHRQQLRRVLKIRLTLVESLVKRKCLSFSWSTTFTSLWHNCKCWTCKRAQKT